jgi:hypothetical protein
MRKTIVIFLLAVLITACFEEDQMVSPHEQGDLTEGMAALGSNYEMQVYYDLSSNQEVASNTVSVWDLSFESATGGWIIRLNSSKFMYAGNTRGSDFGPEPDPSGLDMRFDTSDGNPDSTALRDWFFLEEDSVRSNRYVYLVDRGTDELFKPIGFKKVQFEQSGLDYLVRYANTDNSGDTTVRITRDPAVDCIYYSFDSGFVDIAPPSYNWSLLFSKYTTMLVTDEGEDYPYLVMGALLNPNGVEAALDTIHEFMDLGISDTVDLDFTRQADVIGYDWKYYNFDAGLYTIEPGKAYVIRDRDGFFYKLRFTDFYNDSGEKGHPRFEFVRL